MEKTMEKFIQEFNDEMGIKNAMDEQLFDIMINEYFEEIEIDEISSFDFLNDWF